MTDVIHALALIFSIIVSIWGMMEFVAGMLRGDRQQAIFGLCLGILSTTVR